MFKIQNALVVEQQNNNNAEQKTGGNKKTRNSSSTRGTLITKLSNISENAPSIDHKLGNFYQNGFANFFGVDRFLLPVDENKTSALPPPLIRSYHIHQLLRMGAFREAAMLIALFSSSSSSFASEFQTVISHPSLQSKQSAFFDLIMHSSCSSSAAGLQCRPQAITTRRAERLHSPSTSSRCCSYPLLAGGMAALFVRRVGAPQGDWHSFARLASLR